ncbi:hypothetical protein C8T65DRAFT_572919 [Cerioporus squamosus]|nr:hypothetical protein C8T65DRAFT_572919 [Cerioporus squamosus]
MGPLPHIHECAVRVFDIEHKEYRFLVAFQPRPHSPPNQALLKIVPHVRVRGEILVVRSGKSVLIQAMGGRSAVAAAKLAVGKFIIELDYHMSRYRGKRVVPPLTTFIDHM